MNILHQDESIIVLDKPAGIPVLPDGWEKDAPYLVKMLEEEFDKVFIVHRLDKVTSGVMVFARNAKAHRLLNIQFETHQVQKIYRAIAQGNPKWDEHTAKHPLRVNVGHKHRTMVDEKNGVSAETRFKILKRYPDHVLLEASPMTGRTHQVRVHAYALAHPLLGDILYSASETNLISRPALHAYSLTFTHPITNERISFSAPYPEDFSKALERLNV